MDPIKMLSNSFQFEMLNIYEELSVYNIFII
jgi:hypothetical protein